MAFKGTLKQLAKARRFIKKKQVKKLGHGVWAVRSSYWTYNVVKDSSGHWYCACQAYTTKEKLGYKQPICSHIIAAQIYEELKR